MKFILCILLTLCLICNVSALQVNEGVIFQTENTQCNYHIATTLNCDDITVYPTSLNINGDNITTYPSTGWINMSMENLVNTTHIYFSNNATISNTTIVRGFGDFLISRGNIYTLYYQSNGTAYQHNISTDVTDTEIVFSSIPAGSWYITWSGYAPPILYTPSNESSIYSTYPPLTQDITLDWQFTGAPQYRVITSTNEYFTVIYSDTWVSTSESTQSFIVGNEYWWKVYSYDGTTYSNSSDVFNFNLTGNSTLSGSAIEGVVYADINGVNTPLSSAEVTIWNTTWSDSAITGSNGYYLFTGVADGEVYNVQAKKDLYLDSSIALVTAASDPITQNFYLLPDRTSEEWRHYVKFIVWGPAGYYEGVTITVYKGSDVTALYTAETSNDGAVTFIMDRQQQYRVTAINATLGINKEMIVYPKDEKYLFFIASTGSWSKYDEPIGDIIGINVSTEIINSTHAYVNVSYTDTMSETTAATVYLNQSNCSDPYNQTVISSQSGYTNNWTHSFIVDDYVGESYYIHVVAIHTTYGTIDQTYAVQFDDEVQFDGIPQQAWLYISILIMMFTGGMFAASSAQEGAMIVCVEGWMFLFFGWFSSIDNNGIIGVGLGVATTVAIIANINKYSKKEGHE